MMRTSMAAVILILLMSGIAWAGQPIEVGNRLELFVDGYIIENMEGAELKLHHPVLENTAIEFGREYEGPFVGYQSVLYNGEIYQMYYRGYPIVGEHSEQVYCYAESEDGITFTKPDLGLVEWNGSTDNNIILGNEHVPVTHNFSPFIDTNPECNPLEKYKAVGGNRNSGLIPYVSADGIHWERMQDEPIITDGAFDSQNVIFWSQVEECYVAYYRDFQEIDGVGYRSVKRATSDDFLNWTEGVWMDYGDTPPEHLYTNQTHPYIRAPHIYIAFPMRFMPGRKVMTDEQTAESGMERAEVYGNDCADAVFMSTRGFGNKYDRTFMEGFIRPGLDPGNWASRSAMVAFGVVQTSPTELSIYKQHHYAQPSTHMGRYVLRVDGFVSVNAPYEGGEMATKPLQFRGSELILNMSTSAAGAIRVELQDENGSPIDGYSADDCDLLIGDSIDRKVTWNGSSDVSSLAGTPVKLRFIMMDSDLYSIQFVE